jgi:hypothetical protein
VQGLIILIVSIIVLDFGVSLAGLDDGLGIIEAIFGDSDSEWWSSISFIGYGFILVGIFQIVRGFAED